VRVPPSESNANDRLAGKQVAAPSAQPWATQNAKELL
jgi:hypothetical protein